MPSALSVEVKGLRETQRNMEQLARDLHGTPVMQAVRDGTLLMERDAKRGLVGYQSPTVGGVNTGIYRASITPEIKVEGTTVLGITGSNVEYAPYVEMDTRPHWPPPGVLDLWAQRHHANAFLVARAISRRGTYGKHSLQNAFDKNSPKVHALIEHAVAESANKANGG